jgi:hypothetical protein
MVLIAVMNSAFRESASRLSELGSHQVSCLIRSGSLPEFVGNHRRRDPVADRGGSRPAVDPREDHGEELTPAELELLRLAAGLIDHLASETEAQSALQS